MIKLLKIFLDVFYTFWLNFIWLKLWARFCPLCEFELEGLIPFLSFGVVAIIYLVLVAFRETKKIAQKDFKIICGCLFILSSTVLCLLTLESFGGKKHQQTIAIVYFASIILSILYLNYSDLLFRRFEKEE